MNEENLSDARDNDGMVGVGELEIIPQIQEDEFEHEKISEEGDEMDDREELPTREELRDLVDKGVHSNCFELRVPERQILIPGSSGSEGNWDEGADNEGSGNEKNDE
ncbi:hypothetical protein Bca4012_077414 [Brassica carinata]